MSFQTLINGAAGAMLPVTDRGLAYGDGLFETLRVLKGRAVLFDAHWRRLAWSAERLGLPLAFSPEQVQGEIWQSVSGGDGVAKLILSRGSGGRGYRCPENPAVQRIIQGMPLPPVDPEHYQEGVAMRSCQTRLAEQPALAGLKHLNRLEQVLARREWQDTVFEGLMLSQSGLPVEATMGNLFVIKGDQIWTPDLSLCGVAGVMRATLLTWLEQQSVKVSVSLDSASLFSADAVLICNSVRGVIPVRHWYSEQGALLQTWSSADNPWLGRMMQAMHPALELPLPDKWIC